MDGQQVHGRMLNITGYQRNANRNYRDTTPHQSEWPSLVGLQITNTGEGVEKKKPSYAAGGNVNWYNHCGEQYGSSFKN